MRELDALPDFIIVHDISVIDPEGENVLVTPLPDTRYTGNGRNPADFSVTLVAQLETHNNQVMCDTPFLICDIDVLGDLNITD